MIDRATGFIMDPPNPWIRRAPIRVWMSGAMLPQQRTEREDTQTDLEDPATPEAITENAPARISSEARTRV